MLTAARHAVVPTLIREQYNCVYLLILIDVLMHAYWLKHIGLSADGKYK